MDWSPQQHQALEKVAAWFKSYRASGKGQVFRVFGYAGTGKTTLARHFAEQTGGLVRFAAFTGKAALMMERSGCHGASTIHSLLYNARTRKDGSVKFALDKDGPASDADLIVIDGGRAQRDSAIAAREEAGAWSVAMVGLAKARAVKEGMMQNLLTGRVRLV